MDKNNQKLLTKLLQKYAQRSLFWIVERSDNITEDSKELKAELETLSAKFNVDFPDIDWDIYILPVNQE